MTPSCTSGVDSLGPAGKDQVQATRRSATLLLLICFRGLKPRSSQVRRHVSQSPAGGLRSIASVTGVILSSGFGLAGGGGSVANGESPPPGPPLPAAVGAGMTMAFNALTSDGKG